MLAIVFTLLCYIRFHMKLLYYLFVLLSSFVCGNLTSTSKFDVTSIDSSQRALLSHLINAEIDVRLAHAERVLFLWSIVKASRDAAKKMSTYPKQRQQRQPSTNNNNISKNDPTAAAATLYSNILQTREALPWLIRSIWADTEQMGQVEAEALSGAILGLLNEIEVAEVFGLPDPDLLK